MFTAPRAHPRRNVLELTVAQVRVDDAWIFVGLANIVTGDFRLEVAVDLHQICPAVVVVIEKAANPIRHN